MKATELYQHLKDLAEKKGFHVSEQNFRATGVKAKSGACRVKGKNLFIIDKHKTLRHKIDILAEFLGGLNFDDVYVLPLVRETLDKYKPLSHGNRGSDFETSNKS